MKWNFTFLLLFPCLLGSTQVLTGFGTRWSDSFSEWAAYTAEEGQEGALELRWPMQDNWSEWQYRLGEQTGLIKLKWADNPNEWELRGENQIVTARTLWNDNFREWRVSDGQHTVTLFCRFGNVWDEWAIRSSAAGHFQMYTQWEGDPRDWAVADELDPSVSFPLKMMLAHIVLFHSSPKE